MILSIGASGVVESGLWVGECVLQTEHGLVLLTGLCCGTMIEQPSGLTEREFVISPLPKG